MTATQHVSRLATNPLYRTHRMKLGVMAFNCSHGSTITTAEGAWELHWGDTKKIAQMADRAGLDVLLPVGRWRGYSGPSNFNNSTYESFTWASALGAMTDQIAVFATCHVPPCASDHGGQNGDHRRSCERWAFLPERGVRLVQGRVRDVRRRMARA